MFTIFVKFQEAGHSASERKSDFSQRDKLAGTQNKLTQRTNEKTILQLKPAASSKELKTFLGAKQFFWKKTFLNFR